MKKPTKKAAPLVIKNCTFTADQGNAVVALARAAEANANAILAAATAARGQPLLVINTQEIK